MHLHQINNARLISISYSIYTSSRMLIGVYSSIYLLAQGFSINDLALFSAVFTATIALSEIPISVFADARSRKLSVLLGMIFTVLFYLICIFPQNIFYVCIAYFLYGMSASFISGAVKGLLLHSLPDNKHYPNYIHFITKISSIGSLLAGVFSYLLYIKTKNFVYMYLIAMVITSINTIVFSFVKENKPQTIEKKTHLMSELKQSIFLLKNLKNFKFYLITSSLLTMVLQLFFYFWQPVMSYKYENISNILIYCYIGVFFSQFLINEIIKKLNGYEYFTLQKYLFLFAIVFISLLIFSKNREYGLPSVIIYIISMGILTMIPIILHNKFVSANKEINAKITTCLSILSSISRLFSFILLLNIYLFFNLENPIKILYIPIILLLILLLINLFWKKIEKYYLIS